MVRRRAATGVARYSLRCRAGTADCGRQSNRADCAGTGAGGGGGPERVALAEKGRRGSDNGSRWDGQGGKREARKHC